MKININKKYLVLAALWLTALIPRVYWFTQKQVLHNDEMISVFVSEGNKLGWMEEFPHQIEIKGKLIKSAMLLTDRTIKDIVSDVFRLWQTTEDGSQPGPFYIFLRLMFGIHTSGNIEDVIVRGAVLNLILWTISFCFFYKLLMLLFNNNSWIAGLGALCTFLSTATISNTMLIRSYQLQETTLIIFAWCLIKYLDVQKKLVSEDGKTWLNKRFFFATSILTGLALTTGRYSIVYVVLTGIFVMAYFFYNKKQKEIPLYIGVLVCSIITAQGIYIDYLRPQLGMVSMFLDKENMIKSSFGTGTSSAYQPLSAENLNSGNIDATTALEDRVYQIFHTPAIPTLLKQLWTHYWTLPVLIACGAALVAALLCFFIPRPQKNNRNRQALNWKKLVLDFVFSPHLWLCAFAFVYAAIAIYTANFKELRYSVPVFPFFILLPMFIISRIKIKYVMIAVSVMLTICFASTCFTEARVLNVWKGRRELYKFAKEPEIPAFIICASSHYPLVLPYLADEQTYVFDTNIYTAFEKFPYNEFFLIINDPIVRENVIDSDVWTIEETYPVGVNIGLWTVGRLKRIKPLN